MTTFMAICRTLNINPYAVDDDGGKALVRFGHDGGRVTGATIYRGPDGKLFCMSKRQPEVVAGHGPWTMAREQRFFKLKTGSLWECAHDDEA